MAVKKDMAVKKIVSVDQLVAAQLVDATERESLDDLTQRYSVAITPAVQATFNGAGPGAGLASATGEQDPVARQYVPTLEEAHTHPAEMGDPIGDNAHSPLRGLVHRYPDRVLIKATGVCPVYCRFCFRREMVGSNAERPLSQSQFELIFDYIADHPEIWEVIISGGDPLVLSNKRLGELLDGLRRSPHVKIVRLHSRMPMTQPDRIDSQLIERLRDSDKTVYFVVHANHANEFSMAAKSACARLVDGGIPTLSQSVLLRGVNDTEAALAALMRAFVEARITPYYLHQADLAPGTAHFRVDLAKGQELIRRLRGRYSGLCQPTYVLDLPGGHGKVPIAPSYVRRTSACDAQNPSYELEDYQGSVHVYSPTAPTED